MIDRRFGPLVVLLAFGLLCVLLRAARIQVKDHDIWAKEAANLERSSRRIPYHRGLIRARGEEVLVEDEERYRVSFEWREFRRENPIGQVALAWSAKTGEPVTLISDPGELGGRALELLGLSPSESSADMAFYLRRIVGLEGTAAGRLRQLMAQRDEDRSVLSLAVLAYEEARGDLPEEQAIQEIEAHVFERCWSALHDLEQLELSLELERGSLMVAMAECGEKVNDAVASRMFRRAAGFSAGRLEPAELEEWDLRWLRKSLRWGDEREADWRYRAREDWQNHMLTRIAPGAALEARIDGPESTFDHLLSLLASTIAPTEGIRSTALDPWSGGSSGFEVSDLFELEQQTTGSEEQPLFVFVQTRELSEAWSPTVELFEEWTSPLEMGDWEEAWNRAGLEDWEPPAYADEALIRWKNGGSAEERRLSQWLLLRWSLEWQQGWSRYQESLLAGGGLTLSGERVESALDDHDFFLVEQGRRARSIENEPSYEVVYLLTRYPERFRGFHVETRTRRARNESILEGQDPLWRVIGNARKTNLEEILIHRGGFDVFRDLRQQALRTDTDEFELRRLVESLPRYDELHGADGVERLMDQMLSGRNGYLEYESLSELARREGKPAVDWRPQNGEEVRLTIDLGLQRAASETINHPDSPPRDRRTHDEKWFAAPTGAICLITPEGEVLAAASAPNLPGETPIPFRDDQRAYAHERTLRRYTSLPIGSVFKPFVALWCLEHELVTPDETLSCVPRERRGASFAGYRSVDCHRSAGHGDLKLEDALLKSCNAYFAQLGDRLGSGEALVACARTFGFDRSTGVNDFLGERAIPEDFDNPSFRRAAKFGHMELERGANGLTVLEGTPLQVARAYAGLATGALPSLTFTQGTGAQPESIPISTRHLDAIQSALREVARTGSARLLKRLDVAAKTGSADYAKMTDEVSAQIQVLSGPAPEQRKHTWVAGWAPADDPRLIFVVYLHDIGVTSGDSAVFVARQLLERPEVQAYLGR